jgi:hypothetical protein
MLYQIKRKNQHKFYPEFHDGKGKGGIGPAIDCCLYSYGNND